MGESAASVPSSLPQGQRPDKLPVAALRRARQLRLWGGEGSNAPCDLCRVLISPAGMECEVEAELDGKRITLHFHPRCHASWRAGQAEPPAEPASGADSAA